MRVAIVGGCASGKSTIAARLRERGFDAYVVGQEHSDIPDLWRRRSPDRLVLLEASLDTVRARRGRTWPEWLFVRQRERLSLARTAADVVVDTSTCSIGDAIDAILTRIDEERASG